jgi:nicotinamidase-related amidase
MPLTTLDPKPALIVIDLQKGITAVPAVHPTADIVARSANLATAFRRRGFPVVMVNVAGTAPGRTDRGHSDFTPPPGWTDLVDELDPQPDDLLVTKHRRSAFAGTSLHDHLQALGVTQVVLTGISTTAGVESSARAAHDQGYNVVLATDAMTDRDPDAHHHTITHIFPGLGETASTKEILAKLEQTHDSPGSARS